MQVIIFYLFAAVLLFAATMVVTSKNPVHAALFLVLAFFNAAALWIMAQAEFLGVALVLVYVGAVMVLFLFVVMMLDINTAPLREGFARYLPLGGAVALVMILEMVLVVTSRELPITGAVAAAGVENNTKALGGVLYTQYVYPFEIAAIVLLVAIIAAIQLTHRRREGTRHQDPSRQVRVRKADRLKVVKVPSETAAAQTRSEEQTEAK